MTNPLELAVDHAVAAVRRDPRAAVDASLPAIGQRLPPMGVDRDSGIRLEPQFPSPPGVSLDEWPRLSVRRARRSPGILVDADDADTDRAPGQRGPGIPVAVKDNIDVAGQMTGMGGRLGRRRAQRDSAAWARLRVAGAVLIGHVAMHELAWGVTTPGCPNPWDPTLTPGGSSGGSAAVVAAGIVPLALGTDTGGSVRIPAALCGIAGLRPTQGSAPMRGIAPMAASLDTVGALASTAAQCLVAHQIMAGRTDPPPSGTRDLRVGIPGGWRGRVTDPVATGMDAAADALRGAGVNVVPVAMGSAGLASATAYVIMLIESSRTWLAAAEQDPAAVGADVLATLRAGARIDADPTLYPAALRLAAAIRIETETAMQDSDLAAILLPTVAAVGIGAEQRSVPIGDREVPVDDALARFTAPASVAGLPALSVPATLTTLAASGTMVPVGVQLIGRAAGEATLALLAEPIEQGPGAEVTRARCRMGQENSS